MQLAAFSVPTILLKLDSHSGIAIFICVLALYGIVVIFKEKWRVHKTKNWPTVTGAISDVMQEKVDGGVNGVDYHKVSFRYSYQTQQAQTTQAQIQQEHTGSYSFNCISEDQANGAMAGLVGKTVSVHYQPGKQARSVLWEDEVWNIWFDKYWQSNEGNAPSQA
jgi:hypothetical protein